jgi:uncharacterized protein (DUF427 family)
MPKAVWNGAVLAESDETIMLEGNHYFPVEALHTEFFVDSSHRSRCPWKGVADYYDIVVDGDTNRSAAWYYADPSAAASDIKGHVAFWRGVRVEN